MTHIIFLVHGTWGRGDDAWYQPNTSTTNFAERLKVSLAELGISDNEIIYEPFEWKGGNTHADRLQGATQLASKLKELNQQYADKKDIKIHFVAHSHGGNVVLKALEIYLNEMAWIDVPTWCDKGDIVDATQEFLRNCSNGKYQFRHHTEKIDKLLRELSETLDKIMRREKQAIFLLTSGTIYDTARSSLRKKLGYAFSHVYTLPEHHKLGSVITLGTPFYEKCWKNIQVTKVINKILAFLFFLPATSLAMYAYILAGAGLASITPWLSWIGFNPLSWHWLVLVPSSLLILWITASFGKTVATEHPINTNIYFDEAVIPYYLRIVEDDKICRVLNIHADYLDEAYIFLSSYTFLLEILSKQIHKISPVKFWCLQEHSDDVGFWKGSPAALMRRILRTPMRYTMALIKAVVFPARFIIYKVRNSFIEHALKVNLRLIGYGLPKSQSDLNADIFVSNVLSKPYFDTHTLDVSRILLKVENNSCEDSERFEFIWNDDDLTKRLKDSILIKNLDKQLGTDYYRHLLALEERVKEFFGVAGVRHSMYYDNDLVIKNIAQFISAQSTIGFSPYISHPPPNRANHDPV